MPSPLLQFAGRRSLTDVLVIVAIVAFFIALLGPDSATRARRAIMQRIRSWKPSAADTTAPDSRRLVPDLELVGHWSVRRHLNGSSLEIQKLPSGEFRVRFATGGCLGSYEAVQTATFRDGILTLDEPVAEYLPAVYDRLYAVRVADEVRLLPAARVSDVVWADDDSVEDKSGDRWTYRRTDARAMNS